MDSGSQTQPTAKDQKEKDSVFIKILEYGESAGDGGATEDGMISAIYPDSTPSKNHRARLVALFQECFLPSNGGKALKTEYYFRLLEYRELKESREASLSARKYSSWAIGLSVVAIVTGVLVGWFQLKTAVSINPLQVKQVVEASQAPITIQQAQLELLIKALETSNTEQVTLSRVQFELLLKEIRSNRLTPATVAGQEP